MRYLSPRRLCLTVAALGLVFVGALGGAEEDAPIVAPQPVPAPAERPAVVPAPQPSVEPVVAQPQPVPGQVYPPQAKAREPQRGDVQKVFLLTHVNNRDLADVLGVFPATIYESTDGNSRLLGVSAPPAVLGAIEETIKRLDVPPTPQRTVEITASIIEASVQPVQGPALPDNLQAVIAQLRRTFSFAGYRLLDTLIARTGERASVKISGILARRATTPAAERHALECREVTIAGEPSARVVRLRGLEYDVSIAVPQRSVSSSKTTPDAESSPRLVVPQSYQISHFGFWTKDTISVRAEQQAVIGRFSVSEAGDALILVLSARVID